MTKKILIIGFPHNGTSILRCIIGRCNNVHEIYEEEYNPLNNNTKTEKDFLLMKIPFTKEDFFTNEYEDIIKIFIIRNPLFVFSSINKRFKYNFPNCHSINNYINTVKLFIKYSNNYKNIYTIKYEDLFINNYQNFKNILDNIGLIYTDNIFTDKHNTSWGWPEEAIPKHIPDNTDHANYRVWQNCQEFVSNNELNKIDLTQTQKEQILNSEYIRQIYPDIDTIL